MTELFSSREIAVGVWTCIILIFVARSRTVRQAIYRVIRAATSKKTIIPFIITIFYSVIWIKCLSILPIWDWKYLKDIILWVLLVGVPICFNAIGEKSESYFWDLVKDNFLYIVFLEFIIGTFTFNIFIELIIVPIATLLVLFNVVAGTDKIYRSVEKFFALLQGIFGLTVLFFSLKSAIVNYIELNSLDLFVAFSIPIIMTFLFIPLAYIFAVYAEYEVLFIMLKFRLPKNAQLRKIKWKIVKACKLSLKRVREFKENYLGKIFVKMREKELNKVIEEFRLSYKDKY